MPWPIVTEPDSFVSLAQDTARDLHSIWMLPAMEEPKRELKINDATAKCVTDADEKPKRYFLTDIALWPSKESAH